MSAGHVHVKASLLLASAFTAGAVLSLHPEMMLCTTGALIGTFISPDLDVDRAFIGDKIVMDKGGRITGRVWLILWKPYKTSMKHGRFASHFPIFSTLVRLLYIYFWLVLLPTGIYTLLNPSFDVANFAMRVLPPPLLVYGLVASDTIHFFLDILTKERV